MPARRRRLVRAGEGDRPRRREVGEEAVGEHLEQLRRLAEPVEPEGTEALQTETVRQLTAERVTRRG